MVKNIVTVSKFFNLLIIVCSQKVLFLQNYSKKLALNLLFNSNVSFKARTSRIVRNYTPDLKFVITGKQ